VRALAAWRAAASSLAGALLLACVGTDRRSAPVADAPADDPVALLEEKVRRTPRLYPAWAELGEAWLERARVSRDPSAVASARAAFERSQEIQPNFVALRGLTALANFRHHFEEALEWAPRAEAAFPEDTSVLAMRIEALVSLGRVAEAETWFERHPPAADDFHARAARARTWAALGRLQEASDEFCAAGELARARAPRLTQWARVRAAALWIDRGDPARARALLDAEPPSDPEDIDLVVHRAEIVEAEGDPERALALYEGILERAPDPMVHSAAARIAHQLGRSSDERRHFEAAEQVFARIGEAGEVYALGAWARLLAGTDRDLRHALELAERNALVLRIPESRALVETLQRRLAPDHTGSR